MNDQLVTDDEWRAIMDAKVHYELHCCRDGGTNPASGEPICMDRVVEILAADDETARAKASKMGWHDNMKCSVCGKDFHLLQVKTLRKKIG